MKFLDLNDTHYEIFNNNKEQGYVLKIYDNNTNLFVWASEDIDSNNIKIVLGNETECNDFNIYNDEANKRAKYFIANDYHPAVDYAMDHIRYMFKKSINLQFHYKFDTYQSIENIRRIEDDAKDLEYEDYLDIATFFDEDKNYLCDLIILDGKFGLRYSIKTEDGGFENLHFEECSLNLENEVTLMVDMQNKLNEFLDKQLLDTIEMDDYGVKI